MVLFKYPSALPDESMNRPRGEKFARTMKYLQKKSLGILSYLQKSSEAELVVSISGLPAKSISGHTKQLAQWSARSSNKSHGSCDVPGRWRSLAIRDCGKECDEAQEKDRNSDVGHFGRKKQDASLEPFRPGSL
jgi:hypothetical protein